MSESAMPHAADGGALRVHRLPVHGALRELVDALLIVELPMRGPLPFAIAPHESLMLSVQFGRGDHPIERKGEHGQNTCLTGIRHWTGKFSGAGDCVSAFALLTPLGSVQLLDGQPLEVIPRIRAPVASLLDPRTTRSLESDLALAADLPAMLQGLARWLEGRAVRRRSPGEAALRAARAAMRLRTEPMLDVQAAADEQRVSRRQLERDVRRWIGASPRHLAQVARLQQVARWARAGQPLADIAAHAGFADQAHMSRTIKQMTGLTPTRFVGPPQTALGAAFRDATGGAAIYL